MKNDDEENITVETATADVIAGKIYSLSEIEAQAKKAVRGAGFAWGYAEEVAKGTRLLAAYQLPGAVVLSAYLAARAAKPLFFGPDRVDATGLSSDSAQALCPLLSGAVLCDNVGLLREEGDAVVFNDLAYPLLMLPYAILLARWLNVSLQASWGNVEMVCYQDRLQRIGDCDGPGLIVAETPAFICQAIAANTGGEEPGNRGQEISDRVWRKLDEFAHHTYVPATTASRRGAGPAE